MEVAGLVIGIAGLVGVFKDCIDLLSQIAALQDYGHDYEVLTLKLDIEKTLLLQWASRVRLAQDNYDKRLNAEDVQQTVSRILASIKLLFLETTALTEKYGVRKAKAEELNELMEPCPVVSAPRLARFVRDFENLNIRIRDRDKNVSIFTKTRWVIRDKDKFEDLINNLSYFIRKLNEVIPDKHESVTFMAYEDIEAIRDLKGRQLVLSASAGRQAVVAKVAKQTIQDLCERRILGSIWFQTMNNRREDISRPHDGTFDWALTQGNSGQWDDLPTWFTSGDGIYWISGKAGSGKSTLMKFLHSDNRTKDLLSSWAGSAALHIPSCFLWNLGSAEQKSLNGLMRTLLYHLLEARPSSIRDLLPAMWQDVIENEFADFRMPSLKELMTVFQKATQGPGDVKFCFFIDGLDEYSGNFADAVKAIKTLCQGSRIKAVVSSRPIPVCVEAFSQMPTMRLQDLTKRDIARYVHDTVGSHTYLHQLVQAEASEASSLLNELISKASGVFLWVVLASRSLLDGFAAFDRVAELKSRIDELPPELEDLFRHMLEKVEKRYRIQSVKILRLAYYNRAILNSGLIQTLGLALVDDHDMDLEKMPPRRHLSIAEKQAKCAMLEGRLRSRCGGLLEIHRKGPSARPDFYQDDYEHRADPAWKEDQSNTIIDSIVEFMHRSVYEFLDSPLTWQLDCLQIDDDMFDANAVLSAMSLHLAEQKSYDEDESFQAEHYIVEALQYGAIADRTTPGSMMAVFDQLEKLLREVEKSPDAWHILRTIITNSKAIPSGRAGSVDAARTGCLLLAIEASAANVARRRLFAIGMKALTKASKFPLLYHAISRPLLASIPGYPLDEEFPISRDLVQQLLFFGCDPNEVFTDAWGCETTPWKCWVDGMSVTDAKSAARTADITMDFLDADVPLEVVENTFDETLEDRVRRIFFGSRLRIQKGREEVEKRGYALLRRIHENQSFEDGDTGAELPTSREQSGQRASKRRLSAEDHFSQKRTRRKHNF
ncbi:hypothetical protein O1611_g4941 [Lasiodiplodia mahajangana]|uniref:Uncharacterized protein n=1 Tax=Lasiodiplodia mahajangana TaxID=1108764 RepID=A0ACC2JMF3_9PEZI|nr:hypothetical protein O1611_g4941 [Lasiodiplodia mahajangana]